jgi:aldehyde dehydrogenase (NAD+)
MGTDLWHEDRLLIGGKLVAATGGGTFDNVNPATEEVLGTAADGGAADMDAAIAAARGAFDETSWATDHAFRVRCLRQLHTALVAHAEELRATTVAEVGCPVALTYGPQLDSPVEGVEWLADLVEHYEWEQDLGVASPFGIASHRYIWREATGVVAAITPWNFPNQINLAKVVPALGAGNTVVLKPAPDTPWTALLLGKLIAEETDIPAGVVNIVTSAGHEVGAQLSADPRVDLVSFTGSTATGRKIMSAAAATVKKVFLELGGKSAAIMLDDANVGACAAGMAFAITTHAGQGCAITTRWLVPRSRHDEAVDAIVGMLSSWPYGDPTDPSMMMGPLVREGQRQRVLGYIEKGQAEGAKVALGGGIPAHLPKGYFVEPTVLVGVHPDATVAQEEIFGPVLAVIAYDDEDDAVAIANNSAYGLSGAVSSASLERSRAVARRIRAGTMTVNGGVYYGASVPFGGYRQSGIGRESGVAGFEEYLEIKAVAEPAKPA